MRRLLGALLLTSTVPFAACTDDAPDPVADASPPVTEPRGTTAPPGLDEASAGWDERPDGPSPTPDAQLDDAALTALLRTRASVRAGERSCRPDQVRLSLESFDAATGHRFTQVVVRNTSADTCVLEGIPGIGVRGEWGKRFVPEVRPDDGPTGGVRPSVVELAPKARAVAALEWTGALAGAQSEKASLLVVQLAGGQVPWPVPARIGTSTEPLDIGMFTTLDVSPFVAAP